MGLTSSSEAQDNYPIEYYGGARTQDSMGDSRRRSSLRPSPSSSPSRPSSIMPSDGKPSDRSRGRAPSFKPNLVFASTVSTNEDVDSLMPPGLRKRFAGAPSGADIKETFTVKISRDIDGNKTVNEYSILRSIGSGSYGKVKLCVDSEGRAYALKIVNKSLLRKVKRGDGGSALQDVLREVAILKRLRHPNVVRLYEVMDDPDSDKMFLVMEYVEGGQILTMKGQKSDVIFDEVKARKYMHDIVRGLEYLFSQRVVHRDIKPENLLLSGDTVKLTDFGVSTKYRGDDDAINITAGTPAFMSPEACAGKMYSGKAADIWALGVTLYIFVFGVCPFRGENLVELFKAIQEQPLTFPSDIQVSAKLKDLLTRMLEKDPQHRIKLPQIKHHPWMQEVDINTPRVTKSIPKSEFNANARQEVSEEEVNNAVIQMRNTADDFAMLVNVKRKMSRRLSSIRARANKNNSSTRGSNDGNGNDSSSSSSNGDSRSSNSDGSDGGHSGVQSIKSTEKEESGASVIVHVESDNDDSSDDDNDDDVVPSRPPRALK